MQSRNWCFTLNNPLDEEYPEKWNNEAIKLIVYQVEMGENGTIHLQGYLELVGSRKISYLKGLNGRAHWEARIGTKQQALKYVTKEDTRLLSPKGWIKGLEEWITCDNGDLNYFWKELHLLEEMNGKKQERSSTNDKLLKIQSALAEGSASIENIADEEFELWCRYYRAFEKYTCLKTKPRNHPVEVHIIYGPTGTGKSKWAMEQFPGAYWKQRSKWWDGYFKHDTVVIDEFYGWLPFDLLLRILDRYPLLVETKGGQMQFIAKTIVITSNKLPNQWYTDGSCYFAALARRITHWHYMPHLGIHSIYENYHAFKCQADKDL